MTEKSRYGGERFPLTTFDFSFCDSIAATTLSASSGDGMTNVMEVRVSGKGPALLGSEFES